MLVNRKSAYVRKADKEQLIAYNMIITFVVNKRTYQYDVGERDDGCTLLRMVAGFSHIIQFANRTKGRRRL
jgi:hypothetical protein